MTVRNLAFRDDIAPLGDPSRLVFSDRPDGSRRVYWQDVDGFDYIGTLTPGAAVWTLERVCESGERDTLAGCGTAVLDTVIEHGRLTAEYNPHYVAPAFPDEVTVQRAWFAEGGERITAVQWLGQDGRAYVARRAGEASFDVLEDGELLVCIAQSELWDTVANGRGEPLVYGNNQ